MNRAFGRAIREAGKAIALVLLAIGLLMVVLLAGIPFCRVLPRSERVRSELSQMEDLAERCRMRTGHYPNTEGGIDELVRSGFLKEVPIDPWGTPYHYALVDGVPVITSFGADGSPGGEDDDADVSSLDLRSHTTR